jgi:hypothetical protein
MAVSPVDETLQGASMLPVGQFRKRKAMRAGARAVAQSPRGAPVAGDGGRPDRAAGRSRELMAGRSPSTMLSVFLRTRAARSIMRRRPGSSLLKSGPNTSEQAAGSRRISNQPGAFAKRSRSTLRCKR